MRNEVKTLIAALTTERDSIDRAIQGLRQMSEVRAAEQPVVAPRYPRTGTKRKKRLSVDQWNDVRARLDHGESVRDVAARFGIHAMTVYKWRERTRGNNGAEPQPDSSASATGVQ